MATNEENFQFPYSHSLTSRYHISIGLDCSALDAWFQTSLCELLSFTKLVSWILAWIGTKCSIISEITLNILVPFCTMCLCKVLSSALMIIKWKYWSILENVQNVLYLASSTAQAGFNSFLKDLFIFILLALAYMCAVMTANNYTGALPPWSRQHFLHGDDSTLSLLEETRILATNS